MFSNPHPRRERLHLSGELGGGSQFAGIRTFYNGRLKDGIQEYSVEDRMQRKVRLEQPSEARKVGFRN